MSTAIANGVVRPTKASVLGNGQQKPPKAIVDPSQVHDGLKLFDRWTGWNWEWKAKSKKWDKPPKDARTGRAGDSTDPSKWCSFDKAIEGQRSGKVDGIGFVLGEEDGNVHFAGVDLDDCRNPSNGELTELAQEVIDTMDTYTEVSPSGTGVKVFCIGGLPNGIGTKNKDGTVEIYSRGRYFTVTGQHIEGTPRRVEQRQKQLEWVHDKLIGREKKPEPTFDPQPDRTYAETNQAALDVMLRLKVKPDESDGSKRLLFCGKIAVEHGLSDLVAIATWRDYSTIRRFPAAWSDDDFLRRVRDAEKTTKRGSKDEARNPIAYARITSKELAHGNYVLEYLINGAMVAGQPLIIAGPHKTLKTSFIIDAAISLASGGCFLGRLPITRTCRVAVMTGESGLATIQETAIRICIAAGKQLDELSNLIWSPDLPRFGDARHMQALERFLVNDGIEVLFIDPAYLAMPGADAGNVMIQGELLRSVGEVCGKLGVTMVLAHHTKKHTGRDAYGPGELSDIAWSGFAEFARQWWLINRREAYAPGTGDHKLWLSVGGSAGHSSLWAVDVAEGVRSEFSDRKWEVELSNPEEAHQDAAKRRDEAKAKAKLEQAEVDIEAVLKAAASLPDCQGTKTAIRTATGISQGRFDTALASLVRDKQLTQCELILGNNRKYEGYKLNE